MISKDSKERLFEVMQRVAGLKPKLNENYPMGAESDPNAPWNQKDEEPDVEEFDAYDRYRDDSMDETPDDGVDRNNPHYQIGALNSQYNLLLKDIKRLYEYMNNNNPTINVVKAVMESIISRAEKLNGPEENQGINETHRIPKYTHFALLKNNKIVNGWDYKGYDPEDLKLDKRHYFFDDIKDMQIDPKIVRIVTTKYIQNKLNIDPFDNNNWNKDNSIFTLEENEINNSTQDKLITSTYQIVTPESSEQGDYAEQGWKDEEGESMIPDEYDTEDGVTAVDKAVEFLEKNGANEPSSSPTINIGNTWYSTSSPDIDYTTGAETYYSYHLKGFTPEEEQEIYKRITKR